MRAGSIVLTQPHVNCAKGSIRSQEAYVNGSLTALKRNRFLLEVFGSIHQSG
jgi:hypothetical protein